LKEKFKVVVGNEKKSEKKNNVGEKSRLGEK